MSLGACIDPAFLAAVITALAALGRFFWTWRQRFGDAKLAVRAMLLVLVKLPFGVADSVHPP